MEDSKGPARPADGEMNEEDWLSSLGGGNSNAGSQRHADPFAPEAADPFARQNPTSISGPAEAVTDPFADLLQLSFPGVSSERKNSETLSVPPGASGGFASGHERQQPASSQSMMAKAPVEGPGWGVADPLSTSSGGFLAAQKRKSQESRQKREEFLNQMRSFVQGMEIQADVLPPDPRSSASDMGTRSVGGTSANASLASAERGHPQDDAFSPGVTRTGDGFAAGSDVATWPRAGTGGMGSGFSSLMQEHASGDDVFGTGRSGAVNSRKQASSDLSGVLGGDNGSSDPRSSLFDDIDVESARAVAPPLNSSLRLKQSEKTGVIDSDPATSRTGRMAPSPTSTPGPFQDARPVSTQASAKSKTKQSRGLDLEEVRRRTSLLSGAARTSPSFSGRSSPQPRGSAISRPSEKSSYTSEREWGPPRSSLYPSFSGRDERGNDIVASHPLHSEPPADPLFAGASGNVGGTFDNRGNYFNEDLLLARAKGGGSGSNGSAGLDPLGRTIEGEGGEGGGQGAWRGDAFRGSAGNFLNSARDGAKGLLQNAKTGVDAMGASIGSWQKQQYGDDGGNRVDPYGSSPSTRYHEPDTRSKARDASNEYEVTFGEGRFGFTLAREESGPRKGEGVVCKVHPHSAAQNLGVRLGDIVTGVNRRSYDTYDGVMLVLPKLPRPVLISFRRGEPGMGNAGQGGFATATRATSFSPSQQIDPAAQGGPNPLEWFAKLNPFDRKRREEQEAARRSSSGAPASGTSSSFEPGLSGEAVAKGLGGGVFSWSYYGTSDGVEPNTRDTYTEHVMRCQWGRTAKTMQSWMVARRYREFDALDMDLRDAFPDRRDAIPRLPPKEFFKMAPDVVERRAKGLETYMTVIIRRFPGMLECSHMDRFLTISERISAMEASSSAAGNNDINKHHRTLGAHGSSSNVFASASAVPTSSSNGTTSALVGTDYILNLMTSEDAYRLAQDNSPVPVVVTAAEDLIAELEDHLASLSSSAHLLSDAKLYNLVERAQQCWPRIKAAAAAAVSGEPPSGRGHGRGSGQGYSETLLPRVLQCDEGMERAFDHLRAALASRGYIDSSG